MRNKLILLGLLLGVLGYMYYAYIVSSPQYSVFKMYQAVRAHNYEEFEKYADVDQIVDNVVDDFIPQEEASTNLDQNLNVLEIIKINIAPQISTGITKAIVVENTKRELKQQIEENGEIESATYRQDNLFRALNEIDATVHDKVAEVSVPIEGKPLNFKMRRVDGHWEIFDVDIESPALQKEQ